MSDTATTTSVRAARLRRRSAGRLLRRVALPALLATAALIAAAPAGAVTTTVPRGAPGKAARPPVYGTYGANGNAVITVPWRRVRESRRYARYDQWVCVTPRLYHAYTPDWARRTRSWTRSPPAARGSRRVPPTPTSTASTSPARSASSPTASTSS